MRPSAVSGFLEVGSFVGVTGVGFAFSMELLMFFLNDGISWGCGEG